MTRTFVSRELYSSVKEESHNPMEDGIVGAKYGISTRTVKNIRTTVDFVDYCKRARKKEWKGELEKALRDLQEQNDTLKKEKRLQFNLTFIFGVISGALIFLLCFFIGGLL